MSMYCIALLQFAFYVYFNVANEMLGHLAKLRGIYQIIYKNNYVVISDNPDDLIMEVRRFLYNGQNRDKLV